MNDLKNFFCLSLRTTGLVIGWLGVVFSAIGAVVMLVLLGQLDEVAEEHMSNANSNRELLTIILCIAIAACFISMVTSGLLIYGTMKERHLMLLPWIIQASIGLVMSTLQAIGNIVGSFSQGPGTALFVIVITLPFLALNYYIYFAIRSLYNEIRLKPAQNQPLPPQQQQLYPPNAVYAKV